MRNKRLKLESRNLEVFHIETQLIKFLEDKGILASVARGDDNYNLYFDIFTSSHSGAKEIPKDLAHQIEKFVKGLDISPLVHDAQVSEASYGFRVYLFGGLDGNIVLESAKEAPSWFCVICGEPQDKSEFGNNPWPIDSEATSRCCDDCNAEYVIPARIELLYSRKNSNVKEAVSKQDIEKHTSNLILDDKFIWLFGVMDVDGIDIEEGIEDLDDAIDILINENGTFLVAFPYVDPKPEDVSVDLVFADNPGPVIVYNREESSKSKDSLKTPTNKVQPKNGGNY